MVSVLRKLLVVIYFIITGWLVASTNEIVAKLCVGDMALEDGFASVAESAFSDVLKSSPAADSSVFTAKRGLLQSLLMQHKYDALLKRVSELVSEKKMEQNAAAYWKAAVFFDQHKYTDAVSTVACVETNLPSGLLGESALRMLAVARLKSGDVPGAVKSFSLFSKTYPESSQEMAVRLDWGKALIFQSKFRDALDVLRPLLSGGNKLIASEARYWTGKVLLQLKEREKGLSTLEELATEKELPESLRVNTVLSIIAARNMLEKTRDSAAVERDIKQLEDLNSQIKDVGLRRKVSAALCRLLLVTGRVDEAVSRIKEYIKEKADISAAELQLQLGERLLADKRFKDAVTVYQHYFEIFDTSDGYAKARLGSGWALLGVGRYAEGAVAFEKAYALFEDKEHKRVCLYKMGDAYLLNGQYKLAIDTYEKFLNQYPESIYRAKALFNVGVCLELQDKPKEAKRAFEVVVDRCPESLQAREALLRIGGILEMEGDWKAVEKLYDRVMKRYPNDAVFVKALYGRGLARYHLWNPKALDDFEQIINKYKPSQEVERSYFMRAMCLYRLGRDQEAFGLCENFMKQYKHSELAPQVRFWIGRFAYNTGDYKRAAKEFEAFVKAYPKDKLADSALYRAGMTALKLKEYVKAIELFGRLVKEYPDSRHGAEARFYQADAMTELGKFSGAILVYDELIKEFPESYLVPTAWGRKGDCQFTLGAEHPERYKEALNSYRVVTHSPQSRKDDILQAEYKIGRCMEKMSKKQEALKIYYSKVMLPFLLDRKKGVPISESEKVWFTRAAMGASDIVTEQKDWRQLIRILNRIVEADVAISADAKKKIKSIESEKWWLFY